MVVVSGLFIFWLLPVVICVAWLALELDLFKSTKIKPIKIAMGILCTIFISMHTFLVFKNILATAKTAIREGYSREYLNGSITNVLLLLKTGETSQVIAICDTYVNSSDGEDEALLTCFKQLQEAVQKMRAPGSYTSESAQGDGIEGVVEGGHEKTGPMEQKWPHEK